MKFSIVLPFALAAIAAATTVQQDAASPALVERQASCRQECQRIRNDCERRCSGPGSGCFQGCVNAYTSCAINCE